RHYPWARWIDELGPAPVADLYADRFKHERRDARQRGIGEKHLKRYLDEFAFFFNRRRLDAWCAFNDLVDAVLEARPLTYRTLIARGPLRPWLDVQPVRPTE